MIYQNKDCSGQRDLRERVTGRMMIKLWVWDTYELFWSQFLIGKMSGPWI